MDNRDWERFGEEIRRSVQDAVDTQDFSRLNQTITDTVNGAADYFAQGMRNVGDKVNQNIRAQQDKNAYRRQNQNNKYHYQGTGNTYQYQNSGDAYQYQNSGNAYQHQNSGDAYQYQNSGGAYQYQNGGNAYQYQNSGGNQYYQYWGSSGQNGAQNNTGGGQAEKAYWQNGTQRGADAAHKGAVRGYTTAAEKQSPALYASSVPAKVGGMTMSLIGYITGGVSVLVLVIILLVMIISGDFQTGGWIGAMIFAVLAGGFGILAGAGTKMLGNVKRFRAYIQTLGSREYCNIKELAENLGKSQKFIIKDLEKMISKGWFKQGHLDSQRTCLMVSDDAYKQYTALVDQMEQQKRDEQAARERAEAENAGLSPEVREVVEAGEEYIRKIRKCNDAIPGEEISAKISRMEMLVDRIFDRVEQNPECVSDMHRMMNYYLPTTVKLLEAYEELDAQPVQGENILSSKREIEKTLDTLNVAFEKLLDDLFQDTAWDVSSDISVLHTMLAQEGLTEGDFKK